MNKTYILFFLLLFSFFASRAGYVPLPIVSGFNADVVANGIGSANATTSNTFNSSSYTLVAEGWQKDANSSPLVGGLPASRIINSPFSATNGLSFSLANEQVVTLDSNFFACCFYLIYV